jgi:hypothetical protein
VVAVLGTWRDLPLIDILRNAEQVKLRNNGYGKQNSSQTKRGEFYHDDPVAEGAIVMDSQCDLERDPCPGSAFYPGTSWHGNIVCGDSPSRPVSAPEKPSMATPSCICRPVLKDWSFGLSGSAT